MFFKPLKPGLEQEIKLCGSPGPQPACYLLVLWSVCKWDQRNLWKALHNYPRSCPPPLCSLGRGGPLALRPPWGERTSTPSWVSIVDIASSNAATEPTSTSSLSMWGWHSGTLTVQQHRVTMRAHKKGQIEWGVAVLFWDDCCSLRCRRGHCSTHMSSQEASPASAPIKSPCQLSHTCIDPPAAAATGHGHLMGSRPGGLMKAGRSHGATCMSEPPPVGDGEDGLVTRSLTSHQC